MDFLGVPSVPAPSSGSSANQLFPVHTPLQLSHAIEVFAQERDTPLLAPLPGTYLNAKSVVPKHDARGDARQLVVEQLVSKQFSLADAHILGCVFVEYYADALHTNRVKYEEGVFEPLTDSASFCDRVRMLLRVFIRKISGGEIAIPELPTAWSSWSVHSEKNGRPTMAARHIAFWSLKVLHEGRASTGEQPSLFAVFDGHGGSEVAAYSSAHFPSAFLEAGGRADVETLKRTFELMGSRISLRCGVENWRSRATSVVAAVYQKQLALAWCGDSALLVIGSHQVERISKCDSPSDPDDTRLVEDVGVRVNALLNVTSSRVDDVEGRPIFSQPHTAVMERGPGEYGLILASSGIGKWLSDADFSKHIKEFCSTRPIQEASYLANFLSHKASIASSTDNLTCIIVYLRPPSDLWGKYVDRVEL